MQAKFILDNYNRVKKYFLFKYQLSLNKKLRQFHQNGVTVNNNDSDPQN